MEEMILELKGINGQLCLYSNRVVIKRKGVVSKLSQGFFKGDKEILINHISGIQVKKASLMTNGYIQFTLSGGNENTKGILSATNDENSVFFAKASNEVAEEIKNKIYELMEKPSVAVVQQSSTSADEILKYKNLLDVGAITQDEFDQKKKELLGL